MYLYSTSVHISLGKRKAAQVTVWVLSSSLCDFILHWVQREFWMTDDSSAVQFNYLLLVILPVFSTYKASHPLIICGFVVALAALKVNLIKA